MIAKLFAVLCLVMLIANKASAGPASFGSASAAMLWGLGLSVALSVLVLRRVREYCEN